MTRLLALLTLAAPLALAAQDFPAAPPPATPLVATGLPLAQEAPLANGLRLVVLPRPRQPVVSLTLTIPAGSAYDPTDKEGTADVMAGLLTRGAGDRSAAELERDVDALGGSVTAFADPDFVTVRADATTDQAAAAFALLGDMVLRPVFTEAELAALKQRTAASLEDRLSEPAGLAARIFLLAAYRRHPYARRPTPASVNAVTRADVQAFHAARVRPAGSTLVVTGDITLAAAQRLATQALGGWKGLRPAALAVPAQLGTGPKGIVLVHSPGATTANLIAGTTTWGGADSSYIAGAVMTRILGDNRSGRLVRAFGQRGWTDIAGASFLRTARLGLFQASTIVPLEAADSAVRELQAQFAALRTDLVPARELERAREAVAGSFGADLQTSAQVSQALAQARALGLPASYLTTYRAKAMAVTAAQVRAVARRVLPATGLAVVIVGDASRLYRPLSALGEVTIFSPDGSVLSPEAVLPRSAPFAIHAGAAEARTDSLVIAARGAAVGLQVTQVNRAGDSLVYTEQTVIGTAISQSTTVVFDTAGHMRSVEQAGKVQGQDTKISLRYAGGRVKGTAQLAGPTGPRPLAMDTTVSATAIDDNAIQAILPYLAWDVNRQWTFQVFGSGENVLRELTLTASDIEQVQVPAGTFEAYRADLEGGSQRVSFYVTTTAPRRVVRVVLHGSPIEFLAVNK